MTILEPTGVRSEAFAKLAKMVADSQVFQDRCALDNSPDATRHVKHPYMRDDLQSLRPFALVTHAQGGGIEAYRVAGGSSNQFLYRGRMELWLGDEIRDDAPEGAEDESIDFMNFVDGVIAYLLEMAGADDNLSIVGITEIMEPARITPLNVAGLNVARPSYLNKFLVSWDAA